MANGSDKSPTPNDRARWLRPGAGSSGGDPARRYGDDYPKGDYPHGDDYPLKDDYPGGKPRTRIGQDAPTVLDKQRRQKRLAVVAVTLLLVLLLGFLWTRGDDTNDVIDAGPDPSTPGPPVATVAPDPPPPLQTTTTGVVTPPPPVSTTVPPPAAVSTGIAALDSILAELGIDISGDDPRLAKGADLRADFIDSISTLIAAYRGGAIDIGTFFALLVILADIHVDAAFNNSTFECGDQAGGRIVVCPDDVQPMPAGDVVTVGMQLAEPVPLSDGERSYIYSAVFDSDGDQANDWVFNPPFDFDLFRDTDRWYQLMWDHNAGAWFLTVSQVGDNQRISPAPSSVRAVIEDDTIVFFIPSSELPGDMPRYRVTAFGHDGFFSESDRGADVSGIDPTEPLLPIPAEGIAPVDAPVAAPDPAAPDVEGFIAGLVEALRSGDEGFLFDNLHPAVTDRYGADQCTAYLANIQVPDMGIDVLDVSGPEPWTWVMDDRTTDTENAFTLDVVQRQGDVETSQEMHIALVDGDLRWFTDCGDPVS